MRERRPWQRTKIRKESTTRFLHGTETGLPSLAMSFQWNFGQMPRRRRTGNLTGQAFDALGEVNREELRQEAGWKYLSDFLESKRCKEKIDVLGDLFTEFFVKKEPHRKDGEDLTDYEPRFRQLVRRLDKAVADTGSTGKIPTELYGWVLLNLYMKLDASDAANVRGRADSYKLDDIMGALKKMWSGGGLCAKDLERKKRKESQNYAVNEITEPSIYHETEEPYEKDSLAEEPEEQSMLEDVTSWYQEALEAMLEEPENSAILATCKEARKALAAARTARGFYPIRNLNARCEGFKGSGKKGYSGKGNDNPHAYKQCLRCVANEVILPGIVLNVHSKAVAVLKGMGALVLSDGMKKLTKVNLEVKCIK